MQSEWEAAVEAVTALNVTEARRWAELTENKNIPEGNGFMGQLHKILKVSAWEADAARLN